MFVPCLRETTCNHLSPSLHAVFVEVVGIDDGGKDDGNVISPSFQAPQGVVAVGGGEVGVGGGVGG